VGKAGNRFTLGSVNFKRAQENAKGTAKFLREPYRGTDSGFTYFVRRMANGVENQQRLAYWLYQQKRGFNHADATRMVHEYFYTVASVPPTIAKYRKFAPFSRWFAYNIPLQFRGLLENPRTTTNIGKLVTNIQSNEDRPDGRYMPKWLLEVPHVAWQMDPKTNTGKYYVLGNWIPAQDLSLLLDPANLDRVVAAMLTPVLMEPIQQALNRNFHFEKPIDRFAGEGGQNLQVARFLGIDMPARVKSMMRAFRLLNETNRVFKDDPFRVLEDEATRTRREMLAGRLRREDLTKGFEMNLFMESGFGVLPRSYTIRFDDQERAAVFGIKNRQDDARRMAVSALRRVHPAQQRKQMAKAYQIFEKDLPGLAASPTTFMTPLVHQRYLDETRRLANE